jgi:hypothetical protein
MLYQIYTIATPAGKVLTFSEWLVKQFIDYTLTKPYVIKPADNYFFPKPGPLPSYACESPKFDDPEAWSKYMEEIKDQYKQDAAQQEERRKQLSEWLQGYVDNGFQLTN